jgi:hypothetical protein
MPILKPEYFTYGTVKAYLHVQIVLRFLVRFPSSDECERVDELRML